MNAHVIVEEAPRVAERGPVVGGGFVVRVSGATERAVRELAAAYADRFARSGGPRETADLCHTANVGRSQLGFQTVVRGDTAEELVAELRAVAAGHLPVARTGDAHIDWASLSAPHSRIADLPTYPFARERHWRTRCTDRTPVPADAHSGAHSGTVTGSGSQTVTVTVTETETETQASPDPEASRVVWKAGGPAPEAEAHQAAGHAAVRIVAPDPALSATISAALHAAGIPIAGEDDPAGAIVVVAASPAPDRTTPDLSGFWARLRAMVTDLSSGGMIVWADQRSVAVHANERTGLLPEAAAKAAAVRAAAAENRLAVATLDLDPAEPIEAHAGQITAELAALRPGANAAVAYRRGVRFVPSTVPVQAAASTVAAVPVRLSADGYYLVTGGAGAVGRRLAERLIECGAERVGIVGRSAIDVADSTVLRDLARRADIAYRPCDVSDEAALTAAADWFGHRWGRLLGVVHSSGGANPFGAVRRRDWADAARVTAPKVEGSDNVVRLAKTRRAGFAVLVSSIAGALPEAGRGLVDYTLANAYQLALAERADDAVTAVTAHAWPNWTGTGLQADDSFAAAHALTPDQALRGFVTHLRAGGSVIFPGAAAPPVPAALAEQGRTAERGRQAEREQVTGAAGSPLSYGPSADGATASTPDSPPMVDGEAIERMSGLVRAAFLDVLGAEPGDRPLPELGLDSLAIAELATALERHSGLTVPPSVLMRARTAREVAVQLATADGGASAAASAPGGAASEASNGVQNGVRNGAGSDAAALKIEVSPALSSLLRPLLAHHRDH